MDGCLSITVKSDSSTEWTAREGFPAQVFASAPTCQAAVRNLASGSLLLSVAAQATTGAGGG